MGCGTSSIYPNYIISAEVTVLSPQYDKLLNIEEQSLIRETFNSHLNQQIPDFFQKVWIKAIERSPKLNEILSLRNFCVPDYSQNPKLIQLANEMQSFIEKLIFSYKFDINQCQAACKNLGERHHGFGQFGFQPVYMDIWRLSFMELVATVALDDDLKQQKHMKAWKKFIFLITRSMEEGYQSKRQCDK